MGSGVVLGGLRGSGTSERGVALFVGDWSVIRRYWALKVSSGTNSRVISRYSPLLGGSGGVWGSRRPGVIRRYWALKVSSGTNSHVISRYSPLLGGSGGVWGGLGQQEAWSVIRRYWALKVSSGPTCAVFRVIRRYWGGLGGSGGVWGSRRSGALVAVLKVSSGTNSHYFALFAVIGGVWGVWGSRRPGALFAVTGR